MRRALAFLLFAAVLTRGEVARSDGEKADKADKPEASDIAAAVKAFGNTKDLKDASIAAVVVDVETGAVLGELNPHTVVNPASNAKLYTAAAALAILHGSHKYQTTLNGTIKSGAVSDLVLRGHGDPSLRTEDLYALATELEARGVKKVDDITVDQSFFDEQTTPPAFEQQPSEWAAFRAPVSAVALNGNTVTLTVRGSSAGSPAVATFDPPGFVDVDGSIKTSDGGADTVGLELSANGRRLSAKLSGAVSADTKLVRYTRRVDDPQLVAGYALSAILKRVGIQVGGEVKLASDGGKTSKNVLARHESEPLSTLLYALGKHSDNFYAEMIFKSLAAETKQRPGKSQDSAEMVTSWIEKNDLGDQGFVVKNGSGLFDANRTTAHSMSKLLRYVWNQPSLQSEYVAQLSIGGVDGTLHKRFASDKDHRAIRAKTGTLDDAIALSGYVLGPSGKHTLAFAILTNKVTGKQSAARIAADKLVSALHDHQYR